MSFVLSYLQSIIEQESDQNKNHVIVQEMKLLVLHSLKIMKGEKRDQMEKLLVLHRLVEVVQKFFRCPVCQ